MEKQDVLKQLGGISPQPKEKANCRPNSTTFVCTVGVPVHLKTRIMELISGVPVKWDGLFVADYRLNPKIQGLVGYTKTTGRFQNQIFISYKQIEIVIFDAGEDWIQEKKEEYIKKFNNLKIFLFNLQNRKTVIGEEFAPIETIMVRREWKGDAKNKSFQIIKTAKGIDIDFSSGNGDELTEGSATSDATKFELYQLKESINQKLQQQQNQTFEEIRSMKEILVTLFQQIKALELGNKQNEEKGIENDDRIAKWTKDEVAKWLNDQESLKNCSKKFLELKIDGKTMLDLNENDLKEDLKLDIVQRKAFLRAREDEITGRSL